MPHEQNKTARRQPDDHNEDLTDVGWIEQFANLADAPASPSANSMKDAAGALSPVLSQFLVSEVSNIWSSY